jgi:hypothetical protein
MVDGGKLVRRDYFEAVRQMAPVDAVVLDIVSRRPNTHSHEAVAQQADTQFFDAERAARGLPLNEWNISLSKLTRLDCVAMPRLPQLPELTPLGRGLLAACKPP